MTPAEAKELCIKAHEDQWRNSVIFKLYEHGTVEGINTHIVPNLVSAQYYIYKNRKYFYDANNVLQFSEPYHTHPIAVADMMTTDDEKIVAYLHDVIEDTSAELISDFSGFYIKFKEINYYISENIWGSLYLLTHHKETKYFEYIEYISQGASLYNKLATKVKLADIYHNISSNPSEHAKEKYLKALPVLLNSL